MEGGVEDASGDRSLAVFGKSSATSASCRHRFPVRSRTRHQVDLPLPTVEPSRRATCCFDHERFSLLTRCQGCLDRTWRQWKSSVAHGEPCAQLTPSSRSPPRRMRTTRCFGAAAHRSRCCSDMYNVEAIGHLGKAIDLAESLPDGPADGERRLRVCCRVVSAESLGKTCPRQRIHQSSRDLTDLSRILERVLGVRERGVGIAKQPQSNRPPG